MAGSPLVQGAFGSSNMPTNGRYIDGEGKLYFNKKRMDYPLLSFLGMNGRKYSQMVTDETGGVKTQVQGKALSKRMVRNAQFEIFTDDVMDYATQINNGAGYSSSATSIVVDDGSLFTPNDLLYVVRTREILIVSARSSNTLTVSRGVGSTAAAIVDNDDVVRLSSAFPVNALSGNAKQTTPGRDFNYTQIFRTPVQIGRTDDQSKVNYSPEEKGAEKKRQIMNSGLEHLRQQERAFWYGRAAEFAAVDSSGTRQRTTGGIFSKITSNILDVSMTGVITHGVMDLLAEMVFARGSGTKYLFAAPRVMSKINGLASNLVRLTQDDAQNVYGVNLQKYITSHGEFILVPTRHFGDAGLSSEYSGYAVAVDPENIKYAYLGDGAENEYRDNIQENDRDGYKGEWISECGLHFANESAHGILKGVMA